MTAPSYTPTTADFLLVTTLNTYITSGLIPDLHVLLRNPLLSLPPSAPDISRVDKTAPHELNRSEGTYGVNLLTSCWMSRAAGADVDGRGEDGRVLEWELEDEKEDQGEAKVWMEIVREVKEGKGKRWIMRDVRIKAEPSDDGSPQPSKRPRLSSSSSTTGTTGTTVSTTPGLTKAIKVKFLNLPQWTTLAIFTHFLSHGPTSLHSHGLGSLLALEPPFPYFHYSTTDPPPPPTSIKLVGIPVSQGGEPGMEAERALGKAFGWVEYGSLEDAERAERVFGATTLVEEGKGWGEADLKVLTRIVGVKKRRWACPPPHTMSLHTVPTTDKPSQTFKEEASMGSGDAEGLRDPAFEKATIKKVDRRLLIILGAIYAVSLIDRTNISVARVAGMARDLRLTVGERYSIISLVFFAPYVVFELPSNIVLRKVGCRNWLSLITLLWGSIMLGMAFVETWEQLMACRILLGLLESGFFPGCVFLISTWYTRFETQKRMAFFYLTSMVISGFSNIIGYGFSKLDGTHGLEGWRWIFLIFGVITMGLGIIAYFTIVDFPDKATFLTPQQTAFIVQRINADRGDAVADKLTFSKGMKHLMDPKLWVFGLLFMSSTAPAYAFAYFLPVILAGGGYSTELSLLLSAPPYAFAAIYTFCSAVISDKQRRRALWIAVNALVCMTGLFIMAYGGKIGPRYFGSFLAIAGCQANVPAVLTYQANNVTSYSKRAVSSALVIGFGGIGGIYASLVYRQKDYPRYLPGLWATVACQLFILVALAGCTLAFSRANKKADEGGKEIENQPGFRANLASGSIVFKDMFAVSEPSSEISVVRCTDLPDALHDLLPYFYPDEVLEYEATFSEKDLEFIACADKYHVPRAIEAITASCVLRVKLMDKELSTGTSSNPSYRLHDMSDLNVVLLIFAFARHFRLAGLETNAWPQLLTFAMRDGYDTLSNMKFGALSTWIDLDWLELRLSRRLGALLKYREPLIVQLLISCIKHNSSYRCGTNIPICEAFFSLLRRGATALDFLTIAEGGKPQCTDCRQKMRECALELHGEAAALHELDQSTYEVPK
ncbi:hypothetical protein MNV49_007128 [Pseudohyphozyma bogoriensis]|nr:hypothetical protein MNV49_007128 [Pseudohyphozyma bogoriensis]